MALRINERLNLVIPVYSDDDTVSAWVHSTPISREAFEANFRLISKTFAAIQGEGLGELAGPRVASLLMREIARSMVGPDGDADGMTRDFLNEIRRLSSVISPGASGWESMPLDDAAARKMLSDDDMSEVLNAVVFFTVASAMLPRTKAHAILPGAARLWGAQTSLLAATAWAASLRTSTATANSGATAPQASPAAPAGAPTMTVTAPDGTVSTSSLPV